MTTGPKRAQWGAGEAPFMLMNIRPSHASEDKWSDDPHFQGARLVPHHSGTTEMQLMLDPEKHIERTSRYEGSTDRVHPFSGERQSAADVWIDKKAEAKQPAGSRTRTGRPVHGAGIVDSLRGGESVRNPVRLVIRPQQFPLSGGQPVQSEGHHRVAGAALEQKRRREAGDANWGVPVPFTLHANVPEAKTADAIGAKMVSVQSALVNRSRAKTFQMATTPKG